MAQYLNPKLTPRATPFAAGALYIDRQVTDISDPVQFPKAAANGDQIQIGVVPAGCKLVEHLCRLQIPALDTNAAPTGHIKIGTAAVADALVADAATSAAITDLQPNFKVADLGSADTDTPIYLTVSAAIATQAAAGLIKFDVALRAYDVAIDG